MVIRPGLLAATLVATVSLAAGARSQMAAVGVMGQGNISCGKFVQLAESGRLGEGIMFNNRSYYNEATRIAEYVMGFTTAANLYMGLLGRNQINTDYEGAKLWLLNYCHQKPTENLFTGLMQFLIQQGAWLSE